MTIYCKKKIKIQHRMERGEATVYICLYTLIAWQRLLIAEPLPLSPFSLIQNTEFLERWQYIQATYSILYFPCD